MHTVVHCPVSTGTRNPVCGKASGAASPAAWRLLQNETGGKFLAEDTPEGAFVLVLFPFEHGHQNPGLGLGGESAAEGCAGRRRPVADRIVRAATYRGKRFCRVWDVE